MAESNTTPIDYEFVRVCNPRAPRYPAAVWARHDPEILRLKMLGKDSPEILATMEKEPGFNPTYVPMATSDNAADLSLVSNKSHIVWHCYQREGAADSIHRS